MRTGVLSLHCLEAGHGRSIVLIHGWPAGASIWRPQLASLSRAHHVLAPDLPAYGGSPPLPDLSISGVAGVLQGFLEARSLKDALLVGWSLGARVCLGYCERFGTSHLRGVALVDTTPRMLPGDDWQPDVDTRFSLEGLERTRARWRDDRRALIKDVATRGFSDPLAHQSDIAELVLASELADDRAFELLEDGYRRDLRDALSALSIPVLLLFGGRSRNVTPANREYMARTLPHAEVIVFPESGHNVFLEEPEAFADAIGRFGRRV